MNKKTLKRRVPFLFTCYWFFYDLALTALGRVCPKRLTSYVYKRECHKKLDWENPKDLNQKIQVLKFSKYAENWPLLADHYGMREYVTQKGLSDLLIPIYGVWDNVDNIDFDKLPSSFVLKTNHGCGSAIFVTDKTQLNVDDARKKLKKWLSQRTGLLSAEFHYMKIVPKIMAVKLLENDNPNSKSIVDYKVWCLNGKPYNIMVITDRFYEGGVKYAFYDLQWEQIPSIIAGEHKNDSVNISRPLNFDKMLSSAEKLAEGQPQIRVDFYEVGGKLYLGELTLTSMGGYMNYINDNYLKEMGDKVVI